MHPVHKSFNTCTSTRIEFSISRNDRFDQSSNTRRLLARTRGLHSGYTRHRTANGGIRYNFYAKWGEANPYFDFRTVSAAEVLKVGERAYIFYEGARGTVPGDPGDTQFGLGLARSATHEVDGPWEKFPGNPINVNLPGNVGLGHADVLIVMDRPSSTPRWMVKPAAG